MEILEKKVTRRDALTYLTKAVVVAAGALALPTIAYTKPKSQYKTNDLSKDSEEVLLARLIYGEARNLFKLDENHLEPKMIGLTATNRVKKKIRGDNLKEVILARKQYSCFNKKNANLKKLKNPERYDSKAWKKSLITSRRILEGKFTHLDYGQDHYHKKNMEEYPKWTKNTRMKKIWVPDFFEHYFYEDTKA